MQDLIWPRICGWHGFGGKRGCKYIKVHEAVLPAVAFAPPGRVRPGAVHAQSAGDEKQIVAHRPAGGGAGHQPAGLSKVNF
jgi:hypothetical protein